MNLGFEKQLTKSLELKANSLKGIIDSAPKLFEIISLVKYNNFSNAYT